MGELRRIANRYDASMNEVVLALVAGGLRALLRSRGEPVDGVTIRAFVPVSLRGRLQGSEEGTLIAQMAVPVPLGVADPAARLAAIRTEMERRKPRARTSLGTLFGFGFLRRLMLRALVAQRVNASSTYLPGPRGPVHLAGARLLEVFPLLNLIGNVSIGIGAVSCAGRFCLGVVADGDAYPDLDTFTAGVREELVALGGAGINEPRQDEEARVVARVGGAA
jgi:hypothetical protein